METEKKGMTLKDLVVEVLQEPEIVQLIQDRMKKMGFVLKAQ